MRMNSLDDLIGCEFPAHGYRVLADQVRSVGPDDMRTQYFVILTDDDLGEPIRFADGNGLADSAPGEALDANLRVFLFRLCLCQSDFSNVRDGIVVVWH